MTLEHKIQDLKTWFFSHLNGSTRPYWVLLKPFGNRYLSISFSEGDDINESWVGLKSLVMSQYNNGVKEFEIKAAKGGKNDTKSLASYTLDLTFATGGNTQIAGVGQTPGVYGQDYINAITSLAEMRKDFEAFKENMKLERLLEQKDAEIAALKESKKTKLEEIKDICIDIFQTLTDPDAAPMILGIIQAFKGQPPVAAVNGLGKQPAYIQEEPAHENENDNGSEEVEDLDEDEWKAIDACRLLKKSGIDDPGEKIMMVVQFYIQNPAMVDGIISMYAKPEKNAG